MTIRNVKLIVSKSEQVFLVNTTVTIYELMEMNNDEWLWDIASDAVSKHIGEQVIVSDPQYSLLGIVDESNGELRIQISCYLEG